MSSFDEFTNNFNISKIGNYAFEYLTIILKCSISNTGKKYQKHLINALNLRYKDRDSLYAEEFLLSFAKDQITHEIITNIGKNSFDEKLKLNLNKNEIIYLKYCRNVMTFNHHYVDTLLKEKNKKLNAAYVDNDIVEMNKSAMPEWNCKFIPLKQVYSPIYLYYCKFRGFTIGKYVMIRMHNLYPDIGNVVYALEKNE